MTGPKGEGMFALNFALQGGLENPQVTFNPLSAAAPGFTRQLFPIMPEEPSDPPRKGGSTKTDTGERSSSSLATGPSGDGSADVSEGWLSDKAWSAKKQ